MEPGTRERLLARRAMLQLRIERARLCAQARGVSSLLAAAGVRATKRLPAAAAPHLRHLANVPGRDERVDWPGVPQGRCSTWDSAEECAALLQSALRACGAEARQRVLLVFHPAEAALVVRSADLVAHWPTLHARLYDSTWIVPLDGAGWLVEVSPSDRDLCFAAQLAG